MNILILGTPTTLPTDGIFKFTIQKLRDTSRLADYDLVLELHPDGSPRISYRSEPNGRMIFRNPAMPQDKEDIRLHLVRVLNAELNYSWHHQRKVKVASGSVTQNPEKIKAICEDWDNGMSQSDIAEKYNTNQNAVSHILSVAGATNGL